MWASLSEKAGDAGGSICCSFTAHIVRRLGMPLSHLPVLSRCLASIRFQEHICHSAQGGIWQRACLALPLPVTPSPQTANWAAADLIVWKDKIPWDYFLPVVFRRRCFFPLLLLPQHLSPMPLINLVPWLSWLCHNLLLLSILVLCHFHLSLLCSGMILSSRVREALTTVGYIRLRWK